LSGYQDILFFDLEVHAKSSKIIEFGAEFNNAHIRSKKTKKLVQLFQSAVMVCGHNVINHDLPILRKASAELGLPQRPIIDTLFLSTLLFPKKPYHHLVKDYHLTNLELNNPISDVSLTKTLLDDLVAEFHLLDPVLKQIYPYLLRHFPGFDGFFQLVKKNDDDSNITSGEQLINIILDQFRSLICNKANLKHFIDNNPIELAYSIALITVDDQNSLPPPWLLHQFPNIRNLLNSLRVLCAGNSGCPYCDKLSPKKALKHFFGFDDFRKFEGDGAIPLQEKVVKTAMSGKSLLAVFPTGGGKSLTFQLPALIKGEANRSLTVIISPLQSLMKDQVDVLKNRHDNTTAVTINGMLSPLERSEAIERVREGGANLLYISPESLRSMSIFNLLKGRHINRFVIDEAHCFSSWGQDFRVDYLYIATFIQKLQKAKPLQNPIPVSCFTATAKPDVIEDIQKYFKDNLGIKLELFKTNAKRKNLSYHVLQVSSSEEKLSTLKELLHSESGAKIVYVSRVKRSEELAQQLKQSGFEVAAYHGQLDRDIKIKIQDEFMQKDSPLDTIVATSAFGMGVDKDNVKMVVHYNISDSLENYMQESGRAGRKPDLQAKCYVLFNTEDLNDHFSMLNNTKLSHKEVYQIWQGIKRFKKRAFTKSAREIANQAGWDTEIYQLETRVKTAIAALEDTGYVKREENAPRIFAQSILVKKMEEATQVMNKHISYFQSEQELTNAKRIFSSLISRANTEGGDTRIDIMAEDLGLDKNIVTNILNIFKQINLISNDKDLTAYYFKVQGQRNSEAVLKNRAAIEKKLFLLLFPSDSVINKKFSLREVNDIINEAGIDCNEVIIRDILNYWSVINFIDKERIDRTIGLFKIHRKKTYEVFWGNIEKRLITAAYCLAIFKRDYLPFAETDRDFSDKSLLKFSVLDLKTKVEELHPNKELLRFYEYLLLYLHHLHIIELKSGLLVYYNPMKIVRVNEDNKKYYTKEDYKKLDRYYQSKTEQIHIVGEYAKKQLQYNEEATQFVEDYFTLDYADFLSKHFKKRKGQIKRPITEEKFRQIVEHLSSEQMNIIKDSKHDNILVAAGPGSGKTRVLVHKVASLLLMEDIKSEQFLMLTFSRPAAIEFKSRLVQLVGKVAYKIDVFTYHGFAFLLTGRMGNLEKSQNILSKATEAIEHKEVALDRIRNKSVIVVDEYQDVSAEEYRFLTSIIDKAEKVRVIVVGDDDQNIYEFRGANVKYMRDFVDRQDAKSYFLTINYRAKKNLLELSNRFLAVNFSNQRIKNGITLRAKQEENGEIAIFDYSSNHIILPLIKHIKSKQLKGSTAILTQFNEEAILIASILKQEGIPAQQVLEQSGFKLKDLLEIRSFTHYIFKEVIDDSGFISDDRWSYAKEKINTDYASSKNKNLVFRVIQTFEKANPKKFKHTWKSYLREIRVEDFYHPEKKTILVSTMHKSKGKEFDNVFILLNKFPLSSEEKKRVLYVTMTRAKNNLYIHTNTLSFPIRGIANLNYHKITVQFPAPDTLILQCSMKDVWLDYFKQPKIKYNISKITAGSSLVPQAEKLAIFQTTDHHNILWLSKKFEAKLNARLQNYTLHEATVRYIVVWYDEQEAKHYRIVLPEIILKKKMVN
jgi:ATP-dependent DNA helicase RecQ